MVAIGDRCRVAVRACVVAGVLGLAGCGDGSSVDGSGSSETGAGGEGVLPFVERPATVPQVMPEQETAGPEVPECSAEMVEFRMVTPQEVVGSSGVSVGLEVRNVALKAREGRRCGIGSWPVLRLVDADGSPVDGLVGEGAPAPDRRLLLEGRQRLVGFLRWNSWCSGPAGASVEARLAGGGVASAGLADPPGCDPNKPNSAGSWLTFPELPPDGPFEIELLGVPPTAPAGRMLRFTLGVRNPGAAPISLDPCPVLDARYGESGTVVVVSNELNCDAAPRELGPGQRLLQAMEMELPADEIHPGFVGSLSVSLYTDADHGPAQTDGLELTAE
jgi:hypothetical protein